MSKHTPGPWVADLETYPIMVRSQSETWPLVDELGNEEGRAGVFIANTGENKANARLIAAAPDLFKALQPFILANSSEEFVTLVVRSSDITEARAAIAKATRERA
jgi:hypothetical protein